jgi:hypothetical protein
MLLIEAITNTGNIFIINFRHLNILHTMPIQIFSKKRLMDKPVSNILSLLSL